MSEFTIKRSTRQGIIPFICIWGSTGGGKTESALRLARGLAGPTGKVCIVDTEGKRSGYYSDRIEGGFDRLDFDSPFTPERYIEALDLAEKSADVVCLDSASHSWFGPDGVLDLHEQALDKMTKGSTDWKERERLNWPAWREPKMRFKHLTSRILAFKIPLILCFRGEAKTHMEKDEKGRNIVVTDKTTSPIFDKNFLFEAHIAAECFQKDGKGGFIRFPMPYAKTSHADIRALLPKAEEEQLSISHGQKLASWCANPGQAPAKSEADELKPLKAELWKLTAKIHKGDKTAVGAVNQWLIDEMVITPEETISTLTVAGLENAIVKVREKLKGVAV